MLGGIFEKNKIENKIKKFDQEVVNENFWKDKTTAQKILKEKKFLENIIQSFDSTTNELENLEQLLNLAEEENNIQVIKDCEKKINLLFNQIKKTEVSCFLSQGKCVHLVLLSSPSLCAWFHLVFLSIRFCKPLPKVIKTSKNENSLTPQ